MESPSPTPSDAARDRDGVARARRIAAIEALEDVR